MAQLERSGAPLNGSTVSAGPVAVDLVDVNPVTEVVVSGPGLAHIGGRCVQGADGRWLARVLLDLSGTPLGALEVRADFAWGRKRYVERASVTVVPARPGPTNTGPTSLRSPGAPDGTAAAVEAGADRLAAFERYTGGWVKTATVLEGMLFDQPLVIKAPTVIRESVIRTGQTTSGRMVAVDTAAGGSLVLEDSEVDGCGTAVLGLGYVDLEVRRSNIHSCSDGIRVNSRCLVEESWVHGLARSGTLHPDCIQTTGGTDVTIRWNYLDATGRRADGTLDLGNAAVQIGAETRQVARYLIAENWLNGGNFTVNSRSDIEGPVEIVDNVFGPDRRYGPLLVPAQTRTAGNVDEAGHPVRIVRP